MHFIDKHYYTLEMERPGLETGNRDYTMYMYWITANIIFNHGNTFLIPAVPLFVAGEF